MTDTYVKTKAALPKDSRNGLADMANDLTDDNAPLWALVRYGVDEVRTRHRDGARTTVLIVEHVEPLGNEDWREEITAWAEAQAATRREISGQQQIPTERDELLAAFRELADDLDIAESELEASYADRHDGVLPAGDPDAVVNLRVFLAERRAELLPAEERGTDMVFLPGDGDGAELEPAP